MLAYRKKIATVVNAKFLYTLEELEVMDFSLFYFYSLIDLPKRCSIMNFLGLSLTGAKYISIETICCILKMIAMNKYLFVKVFVY